jgi:hypothetical protein
MFYIKFSTACNAVSDLFVDSSEAFALYYDIAHSPGYKELFRLDFSKAVLNGSYTDRRAALIVLASEWRQLRAREWNGSITYNNETAAAEFFRRYGTKYGCLKDLKAAGVC